MQSDFEGIPQGQLEEGIEKVALDESRVRSFKNSYENIKLLFEEGIKFKIFLPPSIIV
jgi:hypothetical protein